MQLFLFSASSNLISHILARLNYRKIMWKMHSQANFARLFGAKLLAASVNVTKTCDFICVFTLRKQTHNMPNLCPEAKLYVHSVYL